MRQNCPYSELFWFEFFRIWTEYGEILHSLFFNKGNDKFRIEINHLTAKNEKCYISSVSFRVKKDQTIRLILNLKKRNRYVTSRHFKTDKLKTVFTMVRESCAMAIIDLIVA